MSWAALWAALIGAKLVATTRVSPKAMVARMACVSFRLRAFDAVSVFMVLSFPVLPTVMGG